MGGQLKDPIRGQPVGATAIGRPRGGPGGPGGPGGAPPDGLFGTTFDQGGDDRDNLVRFLRDLELLLDFVASHPQGMVPEDLQGDLAAAWRVVQRRFEAAIAALQEVDHSELEAAGLTGPELAMKLHGVRWAYQRFKDEVGKVPGAGRVPGALSAVLGFVDIVADSIPVIGQLLHPIQEHKQFVEQSADAVDAVVG